MIPILQMEKQGLGVKDLIMAVNRLLRGVPDSSTLYFDCQTSLFRFKTEVLALKWLLVSAG